MTIIADAAAAQVIPTTPIADLARDHAAYLKSLVGKDKHERNRLERKFSSDFPERQREVAEMFGDLNSWCLCSDWFTPDAIGSVHAHWDSHDAYLYRCWMDHPLFYTGWQPGWTSPRCIAIVGQPYGDLDMYRYPLDAAAKKFGLRWHVPPNPRAGIWSPSRTHFIVMTLPNIDVVWLPEQMSTAHEHEPKKGNLTMRNLTMLDYKNAFRKYTDVTGRLECAQRTAETAKEKSTRPTTPFTIIAVPYAFPAETAIPQYDWLLGRHLLRGEVSGTAATGGTGKSSLAIVESLAMTSGRQLTHDTVPSGPLRVVLINLEDKRNTMDKRIAAAMRHHGLTKEDIGERLIVLAKEDIKFKIAQQPRIGDVNRDQEVIDALTRLMKEHKADVLSIDSFIRTHSVNENDNSAIEKVVECFEEIAVGAACAVHLWHHTRKSGGQGVSVESARGAQAFIDACRSVRILETMSAEEARKLKIANRRPYFRAFNGKLNFALATDASQWLMTTSVKINNGPALQGMYWFGDDVGVAEIWQHPGTVEADLSDANVEAIKQVVGAGEWREDIRAGMWVGKAIAQVLNIYPEDDAALIKTTIKRLIEMGALKREPRRDERRKLVVFVVPCSSSAPVGGA
jgi:hypothetical protein